VLVAFGLVIINGIAKQIDFLLVQHRLSIKKINNSDVWLILSAFYNTSWYLTFFFFQGVNFRRWWGT